MSQELIWKIDNIFQILKQPIDTIYKLTAIKKLKKDLDINDACFFSEQYFKTMKNKKDVGVIYTPAHLAEYMIQNTIDEKDIINNAFLKIIDPACGCGNLILPCFLYLQKLFRENLEAINEINKLNLKLENVNAHIIKYNLFGFDIDETAIKLLCIDLFSLAQHIEFDNFRNIDFLFYQGYEKFDIIIGNPPYIGHKAMDKAYTSKVKYKYSTWYGDKGDISYCFYGAAFDNLNSDGKITFISSRYFLESPSGGLLRKNLKDKCNIKRIVDFYGIRPFKNAGIDPVILFLQNKFLNETIQVVKPAVGNEKNFLKSLINHNNFELSIFNVDKASLDNNGWILRDNKERSILDKIKNKCEVNLKQICESYQGIVTGCDKAFIVNEEDIAKECLEKDIIKPWIKSSFIKKFKVNRMDSYIIYSNLIQQEENYINCIRHIKTHKDKLIERRECKNGVRKWYELQWGRAFNIFENQKIIFPYKASNNKFAIDIGSYFSADIYCLVLKEEASYTYEFLCSVLNSKVYEYYFKSFAKKLGESLYEYYPNTIMKLNIPQMMYISENIDDFLYKYFDFDEGEIAIINSYIKG